MKHIIEKELNPLNGHIPGKVNELRNLYTSNSPLISALSYLEVLGFHNLANDEKKYFEIFFNASGLLEISKEILDEADKLRQKQKMTVGDAIIAGTALKYDLTLVTRNTKDFVNIKKLQMFNPFERDIKR